MRPVSLEFSAFGSYPGSHSIDFERLHELGIFVVTGPTGAGKSTIFDAMVYALYGALPGARPESHVRSHYVDETTKCQVTFEFEANGDRYRVTRSPAYMRAKKRGEGLTPESGTVSMERFADGAWVGLSSKVDEVNDLCTKALGLTESQFERVVLLPQGKFQQFLLAETRDRRPLLQALFGTHVYERAASQLRSVAGEARTKVENAEAAIAQQMRNANAVLDDLEEVLRSFDGVPRSEGDRDQSTIGDLREQLIVLEPRLNALDQEAEQIRVASESASASAERLKSIATQWLARREIQVKRNELLESKDAIDRERVVVASSQSHRPIADVTKAVVKTELRLEDSQRDRSAAWENLTEVLKRIGIETSLVAPDSLITVATSLTSARTGHQKDLDAIEQLEAVQKSYTIAERARVAIDEECDAADNRMLEIETLLSALGSRLAEVEPLADQVEELSRLTEELDEHLELRGQLSDVVQGLAEATAAVANAELEHQRVWEAFVAGNAPRLARDLHDGAPCPVCGSVEHPNPATTIDQVIVDFTDVERVREHVQRLTSGVGDLESEKASLTGRLGDDANVESSELEARLAEAVRASDAARAASVELRAIEEDRERASEEQSRLLDGVADRATRRTDARNEFEGRQAERSRLLAEVGDLDPAAVADRTALFDSAAQIVDEANKANEQVLEVEGALATERARLEDLLKSTNAPDVETALALVLDDEDESVRAQRIKDFDDDWNRVNAQLETFEDVELPDECPDTTAEQEKAVALVEQKEAIFELLTTARLRATDVGAALDAVVLMTAENEAEFARYELLDRVASRCEGKGQSKISLETWVLAGELDRVIAAANVHLQRMTTSRYRLERTDDAGHGNKQAGLDLAVRDSFTGRSRPPASLSGGEQFQTSLSLALGLADVVSHGGVASGRRFEALFVDEGFGSLDPQALENAMDALDEIQKSGRMVGVITHVEAMKEVLPIGIRVERLANDKGSTLEVRPEE